MEVTGRIVTREGETMSSMLYCVVDSQHHVSVAADPLGFANLPGARGAGKIECEQFTFDLESRRLRVVRGTPSGAIAARAYLDRQVGTPERLMTFAANGQLSKGALASLLTIESRPRFLQNCARIERAYTDACRARRQPCLASGCSVEGEDETCLQPLLEAGVEYRKQCAAEWITAFRAPANRVVIWRN